MILKPPEAITKTEIDGLILDEIPEGIDIEYKRDITLNDDDDKREFLADLSSFANARGGDIIFGIHALDGIPIGAIVKCCG